VQSISQVKSFQGGLGVVIGFVQSISQVKSFQGGLGVVIGLQGKEKRISTYVKADLIASYTARASVS